MIKIDEKGFLKDVEVILSDSIPRNLMKDLIYKHSKEPEEVKECPHDGFAVCRLCGEKIDRDKQDSPKKVDSYTCEACGFTCTPRENYAGHKCEDPHYSCCHEEGKCYECKQNEEVCVHCEKDVNKPSPELPDELMYFEPQGDVENMLLDVVKAVNKILGYLKQLERTK